MQRSSTDRERESSSDGEFTDVPFGEDDDVSLRLRAATAMPIAPTMVQLPRRSDNRCEPTVELEAIDPETLQELPPELQQEILLEHAAAQKRANDAAIQAALHDESTGYHESVYESSGDAAASDRGWVCHVCTFMNHAQVPECEMCETQRPFNDTNGEYWEEDDDERPRVRSGSHENFSALTQRIHSSVMGASLKKIKVPATPATTSITQKEDPTAEDLLLAATVKIQQLQSSASQSIQLAKQSIFAKANAARRPSLSLLSSGKLPSPQATALLTALQTDLNTKCTPGDELYESLLVRLWSAIYQDAPRSPRTRASPLPSRQFERVSEGWVDIGFQGPNPDTDFRGGGLLALKCMVYAFEAFPAKMLDVVGAQMPCEGGKKWYPVCVAAINITCMIAGLLRLGNGHFARSHETYWVLFEEPAAFYQLFFHAFVKMDAAWHRMNASFMEFGVILKATRRMVVYMLDQSPQSLAELRDAAEKTFIDRFVVSVTKTFLADTENGECPDPFNLLEDEAEVLLTSPRSTLESVVAKLSRGATPPSSH